MSVRPEVVIGADEAASRRGDAEHREVAARDELARSRRLGAAVDADVDARRPVGGDAVEHRRRCCQAAVLDVIDAAGGAVRLRWRDDEKLVRRLHRQRSQKDGVDEREDRGVGADAEPKRGDDDDREDRALAQLPQGVAEILRGALEQGHAAGIAAGLRHLLAAAHGQPRLPFGLRRGSGPWR